MTRTSFDDRKNYFMKKTTTTLLPIFGILLSACGSSGSDMPDPPVSQFTFNSAIEVPDATGALPSIASNDEWNENAGGSFRGVTYAVGSFLDTNEVFAVAGVSADANTGSAVTTGSVNYNADYNLVIGTIVDGSVDTERVEGEIDLVATFDTLQVTGTDNNFVVNGTFSGTDLAGTITYDGMDAQLGGSVGADSILGAIAGNTSDAVMAGTLVGNSAP